MRLSRKVVLDRQEQAASRYDEDKAITARLLEFFGRYTVSETTGELQEQYTEERGSDASARRELNYLAAAINSYTKKKGGLRLMFSPVLPPESAPRTRCLARQEAAKLLWTMWRARQKDRGGGKGRYVQRHAARAVLVGVYTATRAGAICAAALEPTIGRGYVDLDSGVFERKKRGARDTNKKQPTVNLPPKLLAHMRRWKRLGISKRSVVEWNGKPIKSFYKAFKSACKLAGLGDDVMPHTLRHSSISWYLRAGTPIDVVSDYCGVSIAILKKHYRHHMPGAFDPIMEAANTFGRTDKRTARTAR